MKQRRWFSRASSSLATLFLIVSVLNIVGCEDALNPALNDDEDLPVNRASVEWQTDQRPDLGNIVKDVAVTETGEIYVSGYGRIVDETTGLYLLKLDPQGNRVWDTTLGGWNEASGNAVTITPDGGCIVAGYASSFLPNLYIVRFAPDGAIVWDSVYVTPNIDRIAYDIVPTADGNYALTGYRQVHTTYTDALLMKIDGNGAVLWERSWGGSNQEDGRDLAVGADGSIAALIHVSALDSTDGSLFTTLLITSPDGIVQHEVSLGAMTIFCHNGIVPLAGGGFMVAAGVEEEYVSWSPLRILQIDEGGNTLRQLVDSSVILPSIGLHQKDGAFTCVIGSNHFLNIRGTTPAVLQRTNYTYSPVWFDDIAVASALTPDGGFVVVGNSASPHTMTTSSIRVVKLQL